MGTENTKLKAFLFPWLAYGHISPFLELAKKLSDRGFLIDLCSTPINLSFIQTRIPESYSSTIQLVELQLPESPELPPHYHTTNGLPLHFNSTLHKALKLAKPELITLFKTRKPDLLICDVIQQWTFGVAATLNIPAVPFFTSGAAMISYFAHLQKNPDVEYPFPALHLRGYELERARTTVQGYEKGDDNKKDLEEENIPQGGIMLISTSREMEGKYMDYLSEIIELKILPIGTLVHDPPAVASGEESMKIMQWLDKKNEVSTVFVSFGSEYFLSNDEMMEIAFGLELSQVNFIWVVRFPKGEENQNLEKALPQGFIERVGDRGIVVEGWAPQAKILTHSSIGGFVSHCGWNSISESLEFGVPIIAIPMQLDQPMNAKLLVEIGVALEAVRDDEGSLHREEIARVIKDVTSGESSEAMRCTVRNMGKNLRKKSVEDIDAAVEELRQVVEKSKIKNVLPRSFNT